MVRKSLRNGFWNSSLFLTVLPLPVASLQNDLNKGGGRNQHTDSQGWASPNLDKEKSRLLAEAAVELREENTRQERFLALAKRLAVLQGQDPDRGKGSSQPPYPGPWPRPAPPQTTLPASADTGTEGPCVPKDLSCPVQSPEM